MPSSPPSKPLPLYLVYGTDDLSARRKADEIVNRLCPPEEQAFGLEVLAPELGLNADDVCAFLRNTREALLTPPFLGGSKTVYVRDAPFFNPNTEPGKFAGVKAENEKLTALLRAGLPPGVHLVLLTTSVHRSTNFFKAFQQQGEVHAFEQAERDSEIRANLVPMLQERLKELGLSMNGSVVSVFLDHTGTNWRHVSSEIEKLSLYAGDRKTITEQDVYTMVAPVREGQFWEFADSFCSGNLAKTLRVMNRLTGQGASPVGLIVTTQNRLREMVVLSDCIRRDWATVSGGDWPKIYWNVPPDGETLLAQLEKDPRKGNPVAIGKMAGQAKRFSLGRWFRWFNAAVDCHADMTGGKAIDPAIALELFVTRSLGELLAK